MVHFLQLFAIVFTMNLDCMLRKSPEILDIKNCCLFTKEGGLTTITGPMYAGKTANLIMYVKFAREQQLKYLVFKHTFDTRTEHTLKSRADIEEIPCITTPLAMYILHKVVQELPQVVFIGNQLSTKVESFLTPNQKGGDLWSHIAPHADELRRVLPSRPLRQR